MDNKFDFSQLVCITTKSLNDLSLIGSGPMQLYFKYLSHAKRQKTNKIWATNSFMAKGLNVSEATIERYKKMLKIADFIDVKRTWSGDTKRLGKSYISLKKLVTADKAYTIISEGIAIPSKSYGIGKRGSNALSIDNSKCLKDNNLERDSISTFQKPINNTVNTTGLRVQKDAMPEIKTIDYSENIERLKNHALKLARENNIGLVAGPGSEFQKFCKSKIVQLVNDGSSMEDSEESISMAINKFYREWIHSEVYQKAPFGLVSTLKKQWINLTS